MTRSTPLPPQPAARWQWPDWLLLALVLAVAAWIRFTHIDSGFSFDELWHLASTTGNESAMSHFKHDVVHHDAPSLTSVDHERSVLRIWSSMDGILHPPLFIVALRLWREVWGSSDLAAHGFSIFCGLVAVGFTFASARVAMNRAAAFLAALALSLAMTQVYFSQEVRAYAMVIALGSAALWLMTRIEVLGATRTRAVALGALTLPMLLTHYFAFGGCLAVGVYGLLAAKPVRRWFVGSVLSSAALYAILWIPFALRQLDDLGTGDAFLKVDKGPLHVLLLAAGTPFRLIVERDYQLELTPLLSSVVFVIPFFLIRRLRALLPWIIWLWASVLPILLLDLGRTTVHGAFIRYLAIATPAVPLLFIGCAWATGWKRLSYAMGAVLSFVGAIYLFSGASVLLDADDLTEVTRIIEPRYQPGDAIVTTSGALPAFYGDAMALTISHSRTIFPTTVAVITRPMTEEMIDELGTRSVWLVSGGLSVPVEDLMPGARIDFQLPATPSVIVRHVIIERPATRPATTQAEPPVPVAD